MKKLFLKNVSKIIGLKNKDGKLIEATSLKELLQKLAGRFL